MLDNTQIFESAENKELDTLIKQYNDLKVQIKDMQETQKKCSDRIKELCNKKGGKYETLNFVFSLIEKAGSTSVKASVLMEKHEELWKELVNKASDAITIGKPTLSMGEVVQKNKI